MCIRIHITDKKQQTRFSVLKCLVRGPRVKTNTQIMVPFSHEIGNDCVVNNVFEK